MEQENNLFEAAEINDESNEAQDHFLLQCSPIKSLLEKIIIKTKFYYTGDGNTQFRLIGQVHRDGEVIFEDRNLFQMADRDTDEQKKVIIHGDSLLHNYKVGDKIFFYYNTSEGNGNTMCIPKFTVHYIYKLHKFNKVQEKTNMNQLVKEDIYDTTQSDDPIYFCEMKIEHGLKSLDIEIDWNDQGWGNQKGCIYAQLFRQNIQVNNIQRLNQDCAPHYQTVQNFNVQNGEGFLNGSQINDTIKYYYSVGGGGGHSLRIHKFKAVLDYHQLASQMQTPEQLEQVEFEIKQWNNQNKAADAMAQSIRQQIGQAGLSLKQSQVIEDIQQDKPILRRQFTSDPNDLLACKVCFEEQISRVFECGHIFYCETCFKKTHNKRCPVCRQESKNIKKIYFM